MLKHTSLSPSWWPRRDCKLLSCVEGIYKVKSSRQIFKEKDLNFDVKDRNERINDSENFLKELMQKTSCNAMFWLKTDMQKSKTI